MSQERRNEVQICQKVVRFIGRRLGEALQIDSRPEKEDRENQAVEMIAKSSSHSWALEHTRIESYTQQILQEVGFKEFRGLLNRQLEGKLPAAGRYTLVIYDDELAKVKKTERPDLLAKITEWVLDVADTLNIGDLRPGRLLSKSFNLKTLSKGEFKITLQRKSCIEGLNGHFDCQLWSPPELKRLRRQRIQKALDSKCPKLLKAKSEATYSVLILESNDPSLASSNLIEEAVKEELSKRADVPDVIYLVETEWKTWALTILKEEEQPFSRIANSGPHEI